MLGIVTICAYGCWYYAFGVLLDPIIADTGWSESMLTASFSVGTVAIGVTSLFGGRLLDRAGHRIVFLLGAALTGGAFALASWAASAEVFFITAALGLAASGTLGFYHVTMPTASGLNPDNGQRAIAVLTIWGAFASAVFLPLTSVLSEWLGWRPTVRVLAALVVGAFVVAAVAVPEPRLTVRREPAPLRHAIAAAFATRATRLFTLAVAFGGVAMSTMLVYQVPAMTALGMPAGLASGIAALRGLGQLLGRVPLDSVVRRFELDGALLLAFVAMAAAGGLLAISSNAAIGIAFAAVAGFGVGAFSPLQGMKSQSLFAQADPGTTMGFYSAALLLAGSLGPFLAGVIVDATGERRWAAVIVAAAALCAAGAIAAVGDGTRDGTKAEAARPVS